MHSIDIDEQYQLKVRYYLLPAELEITRINTHSMHYP